MKTIVFILLVGIFILPLPLRGEINGKAVMEKVYSRDDGADGYFNTKMTLIDKRGSRRERILEVYVKDYGDLIKSFLEFQEPADIEGTRFLTWEHEDKDDTQYLYLPALGRTRRIVSNQKNLRFVNTDFSYEDMQRRKPDEDSHLFLREEQYKDYNCYVIESRPEKGDSQYSKRVSWVEKQSFVVVRIDFYNKKGSNSKQFRVEKLEKEDGIWTAKKNIMEDLKGNHTTIMEVIDVRYNKGVGDERFSLRKLKQD